MKFGVFQLASGGWGQDQADVYEHNIELARLADELGFHSVWVAEHHFSDYGLVQSPLQYLAALAMVTERIRLGTAVVVTPLHNPVRIAEEAAFVDVISKGRLDLGVGRGYQPSEFAAFGLTLADSRERFDECVAFLEKAWTATEPFDWDGQFFKGTQIWTLPRPVQQPYPPMWVAATSSSTFQHCGTEGWQIITSPNFTPIDIIRKNMNIYAAALAEAGHDTTHTEFPVVQQVYVGPDEDAGYNDPQEACLAYFEKLGSLLPSDVKSSGASYAELRKTKQRIGDVRYDYLYETSVTFGDSKRVVDRVRFLQDELGVNYILGWFNFANLDHKLATESMRRFAGEVMSEFPPEG
jgi:natural product biosynthesis luciferase-like monooxygenase protein